MSDRCRWIDDKEIGLWHLPGCWGAIHGGPDACLCDPEDAAAEREDLAGRLDRIEVRLDALIKVVRVLASEAKARGADEADV
jgi:hypothetical protein